MTAYREENGFVGGQADAVADREADADVKFLCGLAMVTTSWAMNHFGINNVTPLRLRDLNERLIKFMKGVAK